MINFLDHIKKKIIDELKPTNVFVVDNSHLHKKHQFYDKKKFHLKIVIECSRLKSMKTVESNRVIFSILKDELKDKIHALQIEIK